MITAIICYIITGIVILFLAGLAFIILGSIFEAVGAMMDAPPSKPNDHDMRISTMSRQLNEIHNQAQDQLRRIK